jgi:hypothetical protein
MARPGKLRTRKEQNKHHRAAVHKVHEKTGIHPQIISIVIRRFFWSMNILMQKNFDLKLHGLFNIVMRKRVRSKIKHDGHKIFMDKFNKRRNKKKKKKYGKQQ